MKHACPTCAGRGYLLDQTYGYADLPDGWTPVQACGECQQIRDDQDAAVNAAYDLAGLVWVADMAHLTQYVAYFPGTEIPGLDQEPGDWAIHWTEHDDDACQVCHQPVDDEDAHTYHRPECALIRGAYGVGDTTGHDYDVPGCYCDGLVHQECCSVCLVSTMLHPVLQLLAGRESDDG